MAKHWFGTSEHVREKGARSRFLQIFFVGSALLLVQPAISRAQSPLPQSPPEAEASPLPSPGISGEPSIPFLELPALDLQRTRNSEIKVGDSVQLELIQAAALPAGLPPAVELKLADSGDLYDQGWNLGSHFKVIPLKTGSLTLPSLPIQNGQGKSVARTNPLTLQIQSSISPKDPKPLEAAPIQPPVKVKLPLAVVIALLLGVLLVFGILIFFVWRAYQRSRERQRLARLHKPLLPEHERALAAIELLLKERLIGHGQHKSFHFKLSEILKHYLGERYGFDAPESTSQELTDYLKHSRERLLISPQTFDLIQDLFNGLDRVKFTDYVPEDAESLRRAEDAKSVIFTTRRPPVLSNPSHSNAGVPAVTRPEVKK